MTNNIDESRAPCGVSYIACGTWKEYVRNLNQNELLKLYKVPCSYCIGNPETHIMKKETETRIIEHFPFKD